MSLIFPVIMLFICGVGLLVMYRISRKEKSGNGLSKGFNTEIPVQEFVNVKDINDIYLYTKDGFLLSYIRVHPFSSDLLSKSEKKALTGRLTEEFSETDFMGFKFLAISRPVDIAPVVNDYADTILNSEDLIQKELLRHETRVISEFSLSGEVVQREFHYVLWERDSDSAEADLRKRVQDFTQKLSNAGCKYDILKKHEIIRLCNLANNPAFAVIEDTDVEAAIPLLINN